MATLNLAFWQQALEDIAAAVELHQGELCALDGALGDGDHGTSLALGFRNAVAHMRTETYADAGALLEMVGSTFISTVGGVTGIVFGTLFAAAGKSVRGKAELETADLAASFRLALNTIKTRGKVTEGDKSMVDALAPAVAALEDAAAQGLTPRAALAAAATAAQAGMEATAALVAKVGRARYQGERAIGHIDPGAASLALIVSTLAATAGKA